MSILTLRRGDGVPAVSYGDSRLHFDFVSSALTILTSPFCHWEDWLKPTYMSGALIVWEWSFEQHCVSLPVRKGSFNPGSGYHYLLSYKILEDAHTSIQAGGRFFYWETRCVYREHFRANKFVSYCGLNLILWGYIRAQFVGYKSEPFYYVSIIPW